MKSFTTLVAVLLFAAFSGGAKASLIDAINGLNVGDKYRVLFITTSRTNATSTDIAVYDAIVQSDAASGSLTSGLGLTWKALGSTATVDARDHTATTPSTDRVYIFNTNGDILAESYGDLWDGTLAGQYIYDQGGDPHTFCSFGFAKSMCAFTGTASTGIATPGFELGSAANRVTGGIAVPYSYGTWIDFVTYQNGGINPAYALPLYALSAPAEVSAVPIPSALWLYGSGLLGLVGIARRKKAT